MFRKLVGGAAHAVYVARRVAPTPPRPTDPGYETDAVARRRRQVLYADWTPANLAAHDENVEVDSNCERVELFLNGRSLGAQTLPADLAPRMWRVPFAPGELRAVGTDHGQPAAVRELRTAGPPARVRLTVDHSPLPADWDDVAYVTASVVDAQGVVVPRAHDRLAFKVTGPGVIAAVDSADSASSEPFQATERRTYQGQCFAILKATAPAGAITLSASAEGLTGDSLTLAAAPGLPSAPRSPLSAATKNGLPPSRFFAPFVSAPRTAGGGPWSRPRRSARPGPPFLDP